eukprot:scaffold1022_cov115-Skeletonema_dohrnii-CCMP3373.AAC.5
MMTFLLLFCFPCTATASSKLAFLRDGMAASLVAKTLTALTAMNGSYMALTPEKAGEKLYHLSKEDITPTVANLIRNNGMSALSLAVTNALLAYSNAKPSIAIAAGLIPRLIVLFEHYNSKVPVRLSLDGLVPGYIIQIACAASLVMSKWIDSTMAMQLLRLDDATKTEQRCMRAQGKTDLINGALVWALSCGQDFPRAMGLSCLAWVAAIIYSDFVADTGTSRSEAIRQLLIAGVTAGILL